MAMSVGGRGGVRSEINVTPLVDVVLVLLIIFMVVTPMLQRGKDVRLPRAGHPDEESPQDAIVLSITPEGRVFLGSEEVDRPRLEAALRARLEAAPDSRVLVKGDEALSFGEVRSVMGLARRAGARGVALGVQAPEAAGR